MTEEQEEEEDLKRAFPLAKFEDYKKQRLAKEEAYYAEHDVNEESIQWIKDIVRMLDQDTIRYAKPLCQQDPTDITDWFIRFYTNRYIIDYKLNTDRVEVKVPDIRNPGDPLLTIGYFKLTCIDGTYTFVHTQLPFGDVMFDINLNQM